MTAFFAPAGSDLIPHVPADHVPVPLLLSRIAQPAYRAWALELNALWLNFSLWVNVSVPAQQDRHTLLATPHPFIGVMC